MFNKKENWNLKLFIEGEVTAVLLFLLLLSDDTLALILSLLVASHDTSLLVVAYTLLKEVGLTGQRDVLHEVEWVRGVVVFGVAERQQKSVRNKFNVLLHQSSVHAQQSTGQGFRQELLLDLDSLNDDVFNRFLSRSVLQVRYEQTSEISMHALVTGDEFVGEGQARHQTTLLEPEDGCK